MVRNLNNARLAIEVAARSDIGCQRDKNEDAFYVDSKNGVYVVCDGMGGHLAGEIASQKAIEFTVDFLAKARNRRILPTKLERDFFGVWNRLVIEAIEYSCDKLIELARSRSELEGMGTTIVVVMIVEGVAFVGHLGDSRLYLKNGKIAKQLTSDHTLFAEFARSNPNWLNSNNNPSAIQRFKHILTRCVGRRRDFNVETFSFDLAPGDILLLCTDGLSNYFDNEDSIVDFLNGEKTEIVVESLVEFAKSNGGSDNITAIVVKVVCENEPFFVRK